MSVQTIRKLRAKKPKRTASAPLHVNFEPEELERYKDLAKKRGVTMRELVKAALDRELAADGEQELERDKFWTRIAREIPLPGEAALPEAAEGLRQQLFSFEQRLARLEANQVSLVGGVMGRFVADRAIELANKSGGTARSHIAHAYDETAAAFPLPLRDVLVAGKVFFVESLTKVHAGSAGEPTSG
jgi:hypothetical protein